jgi:hypothetical protein
MTATTHAKSSPKQGLSRALRFSRLFLAACAVAGTLCATACSEEKPRPQGLLDAEGNPVQGGPARPIAAAKPAQEAVPGALPSPFGEDQEQAEGAIAAAAPATEKEKEERDLAAELKALVGQPTSCLDLEKAAAGGGRVSIRVNASVLPSGSISRASVSAVGQNSEALRCIEQLVLGGSLKGPIEGAPLSVSTESVVEVVKVSPPVAPKPVEVQQRAPATIAQPADGVELAAPADDSELAQPPDEDEPAELAQPAD